MRGIDGDAMFEVFLATLAKTNGDARLAVMEVANAARADLLDVQNKRDERERRLKRGDDLIAQVAREVDVPTARLRGRVRGGIFEQWRRVVSIALRKIGCSYPEIGLLLGGRHHTSVMAMVSSASDHEMAHAEALLRREADARVPAKRADEGKVAA